MASTLNATAPLPKAQPPRALLLDLDDTLYDYVPAEARASGALFTEIARTLELPRERVEAAWKESRQAVKGRLGQRASSHSRLLYLCELVQGLGRPEHLSSLRRWERLFWTRYLEGCELRPGVLEVLEGFRARGGKVAIVTDLTLETQLWKLEAMGLAAHVDALAASEEVPLDKPEVAIFELALRRLGVAREECWVVGDSAEKDGGGAARLGVPFVEISASTNSGRGVRFAELLTLLGIE